MPAMVLPGLGCSGHALLSHVIIDDIVINYKGCIWSGQGGVR